MNRLILLFLSLFSTTILAQSDSTEFIKGSRGIGFDFGPCTGIGSLYGDAGAFIKPECHVNVGLIYIRNKIHYVARLGALEGEIKKDLAFNDKWKKGNGFQSTNLELALGYHWIDIKRFNVIPFISGGVKYFNSYNSETDKSTSLNGLFSYGASLAIDYKIHFPIKDKNDPCSKITQQYLYLRLLSGIYPNFYRNEVDINGGMTFINLTIGGNFIPCQRKR